MSDTTSPEMSRRLEELEVKLSYQDQLIDDLEGVVREFALRVEALEKKLKQLDETVRRGPPEVGPANDPPPHY